MPQTTIAGKIATFTVLSLCLTIHPDGLKAHLAAILWKWPMGSLKAILERKAKMIILIESTYELNYQINEAPIWQLAKRFYTVVNKVPSLKSMLRFDRLIQKEILYVGF